MSSSTDWVPFLWKETFQEMLDDDNELDYGDQWNLNFNYNQTEHVTQEEKRRGWKIFSHCIFGQFQCASCHKIWSSARVTLVFRYRLQRDRGTVIMRPFGQACRSCKDARFHRPGFSQDEVDEVLIRLCAEIQKDCYGEKDAGYCNRSKQPKKVTKPHVAQLCEACEQGICSK